MKHSIFINRIPCSASWGSSFTSRTLQGNPFQCHTSDTGLHALSRVGQGNYPRKDSSSARTQPGVRAGAVCTHRHPHSHRTRPTVPSHACCLRVQPCSCQRSCARGAEHEDLFLQGTAVAYLLEHKIQGRRPLGPQLTQPAEKAWFLRFFI